MVTRRISDEDGVSAGTRNWGRLALTLIPAALGGAACIWISAAFGWLDLTKTIRMEQRTMESVGISAPPVAPITITNHDGACLKVDSSYMDGNRLQFYVKNSCQRWLTMPNYSFRVKAHDGTTIKSERWAFTGDRAIAPDERREQSTDVGKDNRSESVELWAID